MGLIIVKDMEKQNCTIMTTSRKLPDDLLTKPHGNEVHNWAISIMQWCFIIGCFKVKFIGQCVKNLVMAMGSVDHMRE